MAIAAATLALTRSHHYPDPLAEDLRARLSEHIGVPVEHILVGAGSDEFTFTLSSAYAAAGGMVACADPGYWGHEHPARIAGAIVHKVPLDHWVHDLGAMADVEADVAYICNPHNPTGTVVELRALERFIDHAKSGLVVVDEAYVEFADDPAEASVIQLAAEGRCVVLRTMSKYFGLAGLRVGYLVGAVDVVSTLVAIRPPFSVNIVAQAAAIAALDDFEHQSMVRDLTLTNRARLVDIFSQAGYRCVPSQANFILVLADDESSLVDRLASQGVMVRPGAELGVPGSVRVTVPSEHGLARVAEALPAVTDFQASSSRD